MDLLEYFENVRGTGVLATADGAGRTNVAVYARPHVMEDKTLAFIMTDRLTRRNVEQNPRRPSSRQCASRLGRLPPAGAE